MLTISPLKMEFLSRNPDIVQIFDAFDTTKFSYGGLVTGNGSLKDLEHVMASSSISDGAGLVSEGTFQLSQLFPGAPSGIQVDAVSSKLGNFNCLRFRFIQFTKTFTAATRGNHGWT